MTIRAIFLCAALWTVAVAAALPPPPASDAFADIRLRMDSWVGIRSLPDGEVSGDTTPPPVGDGMEAQKEKESEGVAMPDAAEREEEAVLERPADSPAGDVGMHVEIEGKANDVLPEGKEDAAFPASPEEGLQENADAGEEIGGKKTAAEMEEAGTQRPLLEQTTEEEPPPP